MGYRYEPNNGKSNLGCIIFVLIVIFALVYWLGSFTHPCTVPHPNAGTIIECQVQLTQEAKGR